MRTRTIEASGIRLLLPALACTTLLAVASHASVRAETDCAGVAAVLTPHDLAPEPTRPHAELIGCRGAKRVGRGEQHPGAVGLLPLGELCGRGGLADAVHADEEPHRRPLGRAVQGAIGGRGLEALGELVAEQVGQGVGVGPGRGRALLHPGDDGFGGGHPDVGEQQRLLELVPVVLGEVVAGQDAEQAPEQSPEQTSPEQTTPDAAPAAAEATAEAIVRAVREARTLGGVPGLKIQ